MVWLNILDILTTWVILGIGGQEKNIVFLHFNESGIGVLDVFVKMSAVFGMVLLVYLIHRKATKEKSKNALKLVYGLVIGLNILFLIVVLNNVRMLEFQIQEVMRVVKS